ncbi:hypothetical protein [uncultured Corynebacterium sp.]|uniref:hypothetical protein n=1 Tax=uncultured Corynebacterium sp. TaxID=159447 RepID=UPI00261AC9DB|nr:hypothetical protein [uncultured Corynebacterium sp.]
MTTPNDGNTNPNGASGSSPYGGFEPYPDNPAGSHPENAGNAGASAWPGSEQSSYGQNGYDQNAYGQNSYDQQSFDQFDVNAAAGAAGATALRYHGQQLVDGTYGDGTTPHPINDPANNGFTHTKGTGKLRVMEALSWAFKTTSGNWQTWLLFGLLAAVFMAASAFEPTGLLSLLSIFIYPLVWSAGLQQTLSRNFSLGQVKAPTYGKTLGMSVVMGLIVFALILVVALIAGIGIFSSLDPSTLPDDLAVIEEDPMAIGPLVSRLAGLIGVIMLVAPFFAMQTFYAADNAGSFGEAMKAGFAAGKRNYLPLLGLSLLNGLLIGFGSLLAFVGLIVTAPVVILAMAHAYRQISGGPVPAESAPQTY